MHKCCGDGKRVSFYQCGEMSQRPDLVNLASFLGASPSVSSKSWASERPKETKLRDGHWSDLVKTKHLHGSCHYATSSAIIVQDGTKVHITTATVLLDNWSSRCWRWEKSKLYPSSCVWHTVWAGNHSWWHLALPSTTSSFLYQCFNYSMLQNPLTHDIARNINFSEL